MSTFNFDHGDDLSDLLGGETQAAPRALPTAPEFVRIREEKTGVVESCPKCRGTGTFMSYSGRALGPCFACKGRGSKTFANAAPVRAANRAKAADRKVAQMQNRLEHYQGKGDVEAARVAWILAKRDTFGFAAAMHETICRFGDLTQAQYEAVDRCMDRDASRVAQRATVAQQAASVGYPNLRAAFDAVVSRGAKKAQMTVGDVNISLASLSGRNPGALYVKFQGEYAGKLVGTTFHGRNATPALIAALAVIEADPTAAIRNDAARRAELLASGEVESMPCGCCGLTLTDPVSIARGIGPICAGKWGF